MERTTHDDYLTIKALTAMAEKKLKLVKANPSNKTARAEVRFLIYAANVINDTITKEVENGTDETGSTSSGT